MRFTIDNPVNYFPQVSKFGAVGGGSLYIGVVDGDPANVPADRIQVYKARQNDTDLAISQPIELSPGGVPMHNGSAITIKNAGVEFSMQVLDSQGQQIFYSPKSGEIAAAILALQTQISNLDFIFPVDTFADLATTPETTLGMVVYVRQHTSGGIGGGYFQGTAGTITNDNVTKINNSVTAGRHWLRAANTKVLSAYSGGAVLDGVTDDYAAIQNIIDAGYICSIPAGKTAFISQGIVCAAGVGIVGDGGVAFIKMSRSGFNATTYTSTYATNKVGFLASSIDKPVLKDIEFSLEAGAGIRTAIAVAIRGCTNIDCKNVAATGFAETEFGVLTIDSSTGDFINPRVYSCTASSNSLGSMQITGVEVDETRIASEYSRINFGVCVFKDLTLTGSALSTYGYQTDGITLSGGATSGDSPGCTIDAVYSDNVYEAIDIQSQNHSIGAVIASGCVYGVKFVHAARKNYVGFVSAKNTYGAAVSISGSNSSLENCRDNVVDFVVADGIGNLGGSFRKCAIEMNGASATVKPENNYVNNLTVRNAGSMQECVYVEAGTTNGVYNIDSEAITSLFEIVSPAKCQLTFRRYTDTTPDYVTGRYYGGETLNVSSTSALALSADVMYCAPIVIRKTDIFGEFSFYVSTLGAGSARIGIYKCTGGVPTDLVYDLGTISVASTGLKSIAVPAELPAGVYYFVILSSVAVSVYASGANIQMMSFVGVTNVGSSEVLITRAFAYAALPATFGSPTYTSSLVPNIVFRKT